MTLLRETTPKRPARPVDPPPPKAAGPVPPAARSATFATGAFTIIMAIALAAWFASSPAPWSLASFVATMAVLGGAASALLLWKQPTKTSAYVALGVMSFSLVRVFFATEWNYNSVVIVTVTALLAIPVVLAAVALPRS